MLDRPSSAALLIFIITFVMENVNGWLILIKKPICNGYWNLFCCCCWNDRIFCIQNNNDDRWTKEKFYFGKKMGTKITMFFENFWFESFIRLIVLNIPSFIQQKPIDLIDFCFLFFGDLISVGFFLSVLFKLIFRGFFHQCKSWKESWLNYGTK